MKRSFHEGADRNGFPKVRQAGAHGATVARMVRQEDPGVPMLVITAFHEDRMEASLLRLRVRRVLAKPIRHEELVQAVEDALRPARLEA